jgi:hypothetical protein
MGRSKGRSGNDGAKASFCKDRNRDGRERSIKFEGNKRREEEGKKSRTCGSMSQVCDGVHSIKLPATLSLGDKEGLKHFLGANWFLQFCSNTGFPIPSSTY